MRNRLVHALVATLLFFSIAQVYGFSADHDVDELRVILWSAAGITTYTLLSYVFGFDPYREPRDQELAPWLRYIDRWELRSGQATLSMLACIVAAAHFIDNTHFVTAVVSGTLASYMYFTTRLCLGAYGKRH